MSDATVTPARPFVAAGVIFLDKNDRVLMVVPSYKDFLDIPGGFVEAGERPKEAARREVREELNIDPPIGRLLVADWWNDSVDSQGGPKLLLVFDGGLLSPRHVESITVDGSEVIGWGFHAVANLPAITIPRLVNRIEEARAARHDNATRYLEEGQYLTTGHGQHPKS